MSQATAKDNKTQILIAFRQLLDQRKASESKVATKEEEAEKEKNQALLQTAVTYTPDSIVKGMADLQLDFSSIVKELSDRLSRESLKLDELKKGIAIETDYLEELRKIRLVADALYLLRQEHQERLKFLDENATNRQEFLEKEIAQNRKQWQREQEEFEARVSEENELIRKQREQEAADYQYTIERDRKIEIDEYEEEKRQQERELQEINSEKEKGWQEREKFLNEHQKELENYQKKIEGFEEELKQAYIKAKEEAIQDANREAKVKTDLFEKEWEASKQGYELRIQSLESTIQRQTEQINDITAQLQAAMKQAQDLAMRAFQSSGNGSK